jgi:hypothetical protein
MVTQEFGTTTGSKLALFTTPFIEIAGEGGGGKEIVTWNPRFTVVPALSATVRVNDGAPGAAGVPDMTPLEERFKPAGRPVADHV